MKEVRYYYFRDVKGRPVITVCIYHTGDEWVRGIAICSKKDIPNKAIGRAIASGRARVALLNQFTSKPICRLEAVEPMSYFWPERYPEQVSWWGLINKSEYMPELTSFEKRLLRIE